MEIKSVNKIIEQNGLLPATKRDLSLFTLACVAHAYTHLMDKEIGCSFKVVGGLGNWSNWTSMMNEKRLGENLGKVLIKSKNLEKDFFIPARNLCHKAEIDLKLVKKLMNRNPYQAMQIICRLQPIYMTGIGIYNTFWRYFGNRLPKNRKEQNLVNKVARERDKISKTYPETEKIIVKILSAIEKDLNLERGILGCQTLDEMNKFLKAKKISKQFLEILKKRKKEYFYILVGFGKKDFVTTDLKFISKIKNKFFVFDNSISEVKGFSAYTGIITAEVFVLKANVKKLTKRFILVASQTHPKDIELIKKCVAIVTDEGGILSHAAIVAREMKKPCIISTKIATQVFKDGDIVEVDAEKGIVRKIK